MIPQGRYGHTCNSYTNGIIIFGGARYFNHIRKERRCLNDVIYFNALTYDFTTLNTWGDIPENRRSHTSVIIGKTLFIHGGVDKFGNFLSDLCLLDLVSKLWKNTLIYNEKDIVI